MRGVSLRNLDMFKDLVGDEALKNVVLVTTWWDEVPEDTGTAREDELRSEFWRPFLERGSQTARFISTPQSAWSILDRFNVSSSRPPALIQTEMVTEGKKLKETSAYGALVQWWKRFCDKLRGLL